MTRISTTTPFIKQITFRKLPYLSHFSAVSGVPYLEFRLEQKSDKTYKKRCGKSEYATACWMQKLPIRFRIIPFYNGHSVGQQGLDIKIIHFSEGENLFQLSNLNIAITITFGKLDKVGRFEHSVNFERILLITFRGSGFLSGHFLLIATI